MTRTQKGFKIPINNFTNWNVFNNWGLYEVANDNERNGEKA